MNTPGKYDKRTLLLQAENYRIIFHVNSHLLDDDPLLKEQIRHRIGMLESSIQELEMWERTRDRARYEQTFDQALRILGGVRGLIEQMLEADGFPYDDNLQDLAE